MRDWPRAPSWYGPLVCGAGPDRDRAAGNGEGSRLNASTGRSPSFELRVDRQPYARTRGHAHTGIPSGQPDTVIFRCHRRACLFISFLYKNKTTADIWGPFWTISRHTGNTTSRSPLPPRPTIYPRRPARARSPWRLAARGASSALRIPSAPIGIDLVLPQGDDPPHHSEGHHGGRVSQSGAHVAAFSGGMRGENASFPPAAGARARGPV